MRSASIAQSLSTNRRIPARAVATLVTAIALSISAQLEVHAADQTWTGGSSGAWRTTGNWQGAAFPGSSTSTTNTDIATISVAAQPTMGINFNNATNGVFSLGGINFGNSINRVLGSSSGTVGGVLTLNSATINSVANVIIRNSGAGSFTFQATQSSTMGVALGSSVNNAVVIDGAGDVVFSANITGASKKLSVLGAGAGDLILSGTNSFTGGVDISGSGKLRLSATTALPTSGDIAISGDGRLRFATAGTYGSSSQTVTINPTGTTNPAVDLQTSNIAVTLATNVTLNADSRIESNGATGSLTLSGKLSGAGTLVKQAGGTLTLSGATNDATGGTQIGNGAIIVNSGSKLGTGALALTQTSTNNTAVTLNNATQSIGGLSSSWTATTGTQTQTLSLNGTALVINQGTDAIFGTGAVSTLTATITGTGSIAKQGAAKLTLTGNNTFSGGTTVSNGTLVAAHTNALGTGGLTVSGGTLEIGNAAAASLTFALNKSLSLSGGSIKFDLGTSSDQIVGSGNGTVSFSGSTISIVPGSGFSYNSTYQLFSGFSSVGGTALFAGYDNTNYTAQLGSDGFLTFVSAIPEPSTFAVLAGLAALGFGAARRRRA